MDSSHSYRGLKYILLALNFALDSVVVKTQICLVHMDACLLMQTNNQIKVRHYDKTKKMADNSQIVSANKNLNLSYVWSSQRKTSGINKRIKALRQGRH